MSSAHVHKKGNPNSTKEEHAAPRSTYSPSPHLGAGYYFTTGCSCVFLLPYVTLLLSDLGATQAQIGIICALRPWLGMIAMLIGPIVADHYGCHTWMLVLSFLLSTVLRSSMGLTINLAQVAGLLLLADVIAAPVGPMADSIIVQSTTDAQYGRQRLWGSIGWGATAPLAGMLVQRNGLKAAFLGYSLLSLPALWVCGQLRAPAHSDGHGHGADDGGSPMHSSSSHSDQAEHGSSSAGAGQGASHDIEMVSTCARVGGGRHSPNLASHPPTSKPTGWRPLRLLLANPLVWQLLLQCLSSGFGQGVIATFLLLFARDQGASGLMMGVMLGADCIAELPVFFFQGQIMDWLGPARMLNVSLVAMVVRLLLYSLVTGYGPWWILPIELLQGLSFSCAWSSLCISSKRLAPPGMAATMQGLATAVFTGVGAGLGGLMGGLLLQYQLGWSSTWAASGCLVAAVWLLAATAPLVVQGARKAWSWRSRKGKKVNT